MTRGYSDDCDCLYCKGVRREREQDRKDAEAKCQPEAIEAIMRNSILPKWQTFDLIEEWCIEQWGTFISDEEMEIMWAKRERVM